MQLATSLVETLVITFSYVLGQVKIPWRRNHKTVRAKRVFPAQFSEDKRKVKWRLECVLRVDSAVRWCKYWIFTAKSLEVTIRYIKLVRDIIIRHKKNENSILTDGAKMGPKEKYKLPVGPLTPSLSLRNCEQKTLLQTEGFIVCI